MLAKQETSETPTAAKLNETTRNSKRNPTAT
jgi:hypothetical protein